MVGRVAPRAPLNAAIDERRARSDAPYPVLPDLSYLLYRAATGPFCRATRPTVVRHTRALNGERILRSPRRQIAAGHGQVGRSTRTCSDPLTHCNPSTFIS